MAIRTHQPSNDRLRDRRITVRRVFSIGRTITLIRKNCITGESQLFLVEEHVSADVEMGQRSTSGRPPKMGRTHVSKGCEGLAGYSRCLPGCCLDQRFRALPWFCRKDFANPSRNFASALRRATSQASRVVASPSDSRISWRSETPDLADDRRSEAAVSRNATISEVLAR
jgi:hypothetical protein